MKGRKHSDTSTVMASGAGANCRIICDTLTFSAVATTGERVLQLGEITFSNGLYATIGGTANLTVTYK